LGLPYSVSSPSRWRQPRQPPKNRRQRIRRRKLLDFLQVPTPLRGQPITDARGFVKIRDKIDTANRGVAKLAKEKWLAAIELHDGKAKRLEIQEQFDQLILKNFQQESRNHTQAELEANCLGLLRADPSKVFFTNEYPSKVSLMFDYRVGYPWSPPGCEYRVTFPHEPQLSTVTVDERVDIQSRDTRGIRFALYKCNLPDDYCAAHRRG